MARQEDTCWSCEAAWDYRRAARRNAQRVIPGGHAARPAGKGQPSAPAVVGEAPAAAQARFGRGFTGRGRRLGVERSRRIGAQIAAGQS
jgi:uracil-DNA glycosylase